MFSSLFGDQNSAPIMVTPDMSRKLTTKEYHKIVRHLARINEEVLQTASVNQEGQIEVFAAKLFELDEYCAEYIRKQFQDAGWCAMVNLEHQYLFLARKMPVKVYWREYEYHGNLGQLTFYDNELLLEIEFDGDEYLELEFPTKEHPIHRDCVRMYQDRVLLVTAFGSKSEKGVAALYFQPHDGIEELLAKAAETAQKECADE